MRSSRPPFHRAAAQTARKKPRVIQGERAGEWCKEEGPRRTSEGLPCQSRGSGDTRRLGRLDRADVTAVVAQARRGRLVVDNARDPHTHGAQAVLLLGDAEFLVRLDDG